MEDYVQNLQKAILYAKENEDWKSYCNLISRVYDYGFDIYLKTINVLKYEKLNPKEDSHKKFKIIKEIYKVQNNLNELNIFHTELFERLNNFD